MTIKEFQKILNIYKTEIINNYYKTIPLNWSFHAHLLWICDNIIIKKNKGENEKASLFLKILQIEMIRSGMNIYYFK